MDDDDLLRCPFCETVLAFEWHDGNVHEWHGAIVYEPGYRVGVCPHCDWREDD